MTFRELPPERRVFHYRQKAAYRKTLKEKAHKLLGNACACGSTDNLRVRASNPSLKALARHPEGLHLRILKDPIAASQVHLICHLCRTRASISNGEKN